MDDDAHGNASFSFESTINDAGFAAPYAGAFFPGSQHFVVAGGVFTSNVTNHVHHAAPKLPPDFRRIPMGDIDLRKEIRLNMVNAVDWRRARGSVRRMYSARIYGSGRKADMTVALYEGPNTEKHWQEAILRYSWLRHPNFVQIFGAASSSGTHAIVLHDDLIPLYEFMKLYDSPVLTVYIWASVDMEFLTAQQYFEDMFQAILCTSDCTSWIRRSTGRLCMELTPSEFCEPGFFPGVEITPRDSQEPFNGRNPEAEAIKSLRVEHYHQTCFRYLRQLRSVRVSVQAELKIGAIISNSNLEILLEIAVLPSVEFNMRGWQTPHTPHTVMGKVTKDGWTRYNSSDVFNTTIYFSAAFYHTGSWLSQANYVFSQLQITTNYDDYAVLAFISFDLTIPATPHFPPDGYLFVCPKEDFQTGPVTFRWPDVPAYWSLDPSGVEHLSTEEAAHLGFPPIELTTDIDVRSWDASVYAGLRRFHAAKGFNPHSQDLARTLGYTLYLLSEETEVLFAHVDDEASDAEPESESNSSGHIKELSDAETENQNLYSVRTDDKISEAIDSVTHEVASHLWNELDLLLSQTGWTDTQTPVFSLMKKIAPQLGGAAKDEASPDSVPLHEFKVEKSFVRKYEDNDSEFWINSCWTWKMFKLMKLALIMALVFMLGYDYAQKFMF